MLRRMFPHYGGKWRLSGRCPAPRYDRIVEPFAGGAGYSLRYGAGREVHLYDTDADTVAIWRYLLSASPEQILRLPVESIYDRADIRTLGLDRPEMLLIQRWLTPQGSTSNWRMPPSKLQYVDTHPMSMWSTRVRQRIADQIPAIRRWRVHLASYEDIDTSEAVTWHVDPPYQGNDYAAGAYGHAPIDYAALSSWCRSLRGQVMVHEQQGAAWLPFTTLDATAPTGRATTAGGRGKRHEVWWCGGRP